MPKIEVVSRSGAVSSIDAEVGQTLKDAIIGNGFHEMLATCGGFCSCATCHVFIDDAALASLSAVSEDEDFLLAGIRHRRENSRLACQIVLQHSDGTLRAIIAPEE